jgi:hypothetical protein
MRKIANKSDFDKALKLAEEAKELAMELNEKIRLLHNLGMDTDVNVTDLRETHAMSARPLLAVSHRLYLGRGVFVNPQELFDACSNVRTDNLVATHHPRCLYNPNTGNPCTCGVLPGGGL